MSREGERVKGDGAVEHRFSEFYSGDKPVPNVQKYKEAQEPDDHPKKDNKEMDDDVEKGTGSREVWDPITRRNVNIMDRGGTKTIQEVNITVPREALRTESGDGVERVGSSEGKEHDVVQSDKAEDRETETDRENRVEERQRGIRDRGNGFVDVPMQGDKTNLLFFPFPSPDWDHYHSQVRKVVFTYGSALVLISYIVHFSNLGWTGGIVAAILMGIGVYNLDRQLVASWHDVKFDVERQRGRSDVVSQVPESTEWVNHFLETLWPFVNPDLFVSLLDKLEDVMQASMPNFIHSIKVSDLRQGDNSLRILSIRHLPACDDDDREATIHQDKETEEDIKRGHYVNLEIAFAYRSPPKRCKSSNAHMMIHFFAGLRNVIGVPIPVWVEAREAIGTLRTRLQIIQEPPFVKNATFSFMGLPRVEISAMPMTKHFLNVMDLPFISHFTKSSINAAMAEYVAPKSLTMDISHIISGDDIKRDTKAVGVIYIIIHRAQGLKASDRNGKSDPYITVAMSKYAKPMYSTRVIRKCSEPIYEEDTAILVTPEIIKANESLSLQLWDSDRFTQDDLLGKVEIDINDLIRASKKGLGMEKRTDNLVGFDKETTEPGQLIWSVGFYKKRKFNMSLKTDGADPRVPPDLAEDNDFKAHVVKSDTESEATSVFVPPDPEYPSGEEVEEGDEAPTTYAQIILNDLTIYQTRTKPYSSMPFFNAGTERFIRDWKTAQVIITLRDNRMREHDALLGAVQLNLVQILKNASQLTAFYPIVGGIGYAKIRISLIFRSIELKLPRNLLSWDVGTLQITSSLKAQLNQSFTCQKIRFHTMNRSKRIKTHLNKNGEWEIPLPLQMSFNRRYVSALIIAFHTWGSKPIAMAILWLKHLIDEDEISIRIPIWKAKDYTQLEQNFLEKGDESERFDAERIGWLEFTGCSKRGMGMGGLNKVRSQPGHHDRMLVEAHEAAQEGKDGDSVEVESVRKTDCSDDDEFRHVDGEYSNDESDSSLSDVGIDEGHDEDHSNGHRFKGPKQMYREYKEKRHELHKRQRGIMGNKGMYLLQNSL